MYPWVLSGAINIKSKQCGIINFKLTIHTKYDGMLIFLCRRQGRVTKCQHENRYIVHKIAKNYALLWQCCTGTWFGMNADVKLVKWMLDCPIFTYKSTRYYFFQPGEYFYFCIYRDD